MAEGQVLPLIVFALLMGVGIVMAKEEGGPVARVFDSGAVVMQKVTAVVMELTPFGVFSLMAWVAGTMGNGALAALAKLVALNYLGCLLIILGMYSLIIKLLARLPVVAFFRGIADAMVVAYSTASSNATLPVTLRCAQRNLGVSRPTSSFIVSLGATINMDGTAMYLGLATLFGAQLFGVHLNFGDYILISVLATLGSVGAAGIPGAGLIMMTLVFSAVGVPLETIAFVAGVDRIMDMMRTATNVTGDSTVTATVAVLTGEIDRIEMVSADDV
jgi:Na+/H+-dicarboxylate symporter